MQKKETAAAKHNHAEAFMLMQYQDQVTGEIELIWNSRDGVTPFLVCSKKGNNSQHINWHNDMYLPRHRPKIGDRVFVDMDIDEAKRIESEKVETYWNNDFGVMPPLSKQFKTKEEAISMFLSNYRKGEPYLKEIKNTNDIYSLTPSK